MDEPLFSEENTQWLENPVFDSNLRLWHVLGIVFFSFISVVVLLCCCFRFRLPRTKQEIEADYQRRKIVKKFRKKVQKFENAEMIDAEMNLKKESSSSEPALEKIRAEFAKENQKTASPSSESENDESNYDDAKAARKKKMLTIPKKDQLIQTIYTGNCYDNAAPLTLEVGGN